MSTDELICYYVQCDYKAEDNAEEGIITIAVNDVIEVRRSDFPDDATEEHPEGTFIHFLCYAFCLVL